MNSAMSHYPSYPEHELDPDEEQMRTWSPRDIIRYTVRVRKSRRTDDSVPAARRSAKNDEL